MHRQFFMFVKWLLIRHRGDRRRQEVLAAAVSHGTPLAGHGFTRSSPVDEGSSAGENGGGNWRQFERFASLTPADEKRQSQSGKDALRSHLLSSPLVTGGCVHAKNAAFNLTRLHGIRQRAAARRCPRWCFFFPIELGALLQPLIG